MKRVWYVVKRDADGVYLRNPFTVDWVNNLLDANRYLVAKEAQAAKEATGVPCAVVRVNLNAKNLD